MVHADIIPWGSFSYFTKCTQHKVRCLCARAWLVVLCSPIPFLRWLDLSAIRTRSYATESPLNSDNLSGTRELVAVPIECWISVLLSSSRWWQWVFLVFDSLAALDFFGWQVLVPVLWNILVPVWTWLPLRISFCPRNQDEDPTKSHVWFLPQNISFLPIQSHCSDSISLPEILVWCPAWI